MTLRLREQQTFIQYELVVVVGSSVVVDDIEVVVAV